MTKPTSASRLQLAAAPMLFLLLGLIYATWAARIPAIRDGLSMNPAQLGIVLLCAGIGAVISFPLAAWLVGRFGARYGALVAGVVLIAIKKSLAVRSCRGCMRGFASVHFPARYSAAPSPAPRFLLCCIS